VPLIASEDGESHEIPKRLYEQRERGNSAKVLGEIRGGRKSSEVGVRLKRDGAEVYFGHFETKAFTLENPVRSFSEEMRDAAAGVRCESQQKHDPPEN
jgi:hypothetical protein